MFKLLMLGLNANIDGSGLSHRTRIFQIFFPDQISQWVKNKYDLESVIEVLSEEQRQQVLDADLLGLKSQPTNTPSIQDLSLGVNANEPTINKLPPSDARPDASELEVANVPMPIWSFVLACAATALSIIILLAGLAAALVVLGTLVGGPWAALAIAGAVWLGTTPTVMGSVGAALTVAGGVSTVVSLGLFSQSKTKVSTSPLVLESHPQYVDRQNEYDTMFATNR